jgi:hypothetical protein
MSAAQQLLRAIWMFFWAWILGWKREEEQKQALE